MPSRQSFDDSLDRLRVVARNLTSEERELLSTALDNIANSLEEAALVEEPDHRSRLVRQLTKYTARKPRKPVGERPLDALERLASLRNSVFHRDIFAMPLQEFRQVCSAFWKALESTAEAWHPDELANLLAFSIRERKPDINPYEAGAFKVARYYRALFDLMDSHTQREIFPSLVIRIFSEPQFKHARARRRSR